MRSPATTVLVSMSTPFMAAAMLAACSGPEGYRISEAAAKRYADERCRALSECCAAVEPDCSSTRVDAMLGYASLDAELTFDKACMDQVQAWVDGKISCSASSGSGEGSEPPNCQLAHGAKEIDEPCIYFDDLGYFGSNCRQGLSCVGGLCVNVNQVIEQAPVGERCDLPGWVCVADAFCGGDGSCEASAALGAECVDPAGCAGLAMNYCAGLDLDHGKPGVCQARGGLGAACQTDDGCGFLSDGGTSELLVCSGGECSHRPSAVCDAPNDPT